MPMHVPTQIAERDQLLAFLANQRAAVINATFGLDEEGARATATASELSLGGLVKHLALAERQWTSHLTRTSSVPAGGPDDEMSMERCFASFGLTGDETLAGGVDDYRHAAAATDAAVAAEADLDRAVPLPPAPWMPHGRCTVRWVVLHLLEETARHAGHADVIRQSLDGAQSGPLMAAAEGWPADGWITPWSPS